jgi:hypothetical protein
LGLKNSKNPKKKIKAPPISSRKFDMKCGSVFVSGERAEANFWYKNDNNPITIFGPELKKNP